MNQQQLHNELLAKLLSVCNDEIVRQMTLDTYVQAIINFSAGSIFYACDSVNRLDLYDTEMIPKEIQHMMTAMKEHRELPNRIAED